MIKKRLLPGMILFVLSALVVSCKDDPVVPNLGSLSQTFENLPDLGNNYKYEGWLIYGDGNKKMSISTGRFGSAGSVDPMLINKEVLNKATKYTLTIEPANETAENKNKPSDFVFAEGDFKDGKLNLTKTNIWDGNFTGAKGQFLLTAYPEDHGKGIGVWFVDKMPLPTKGGFTNLPKLSNKWIYEGWVVVKDSEDKSVAISTGRFSDSDKADLSGNKFKGSHDAFVFPGEDFFKDTNPKTYPKVTFPIDLGKQGTKVVISIEPKENDDPAPFALKPFFKEIGKGQELGKKVDLENKFEKAFSGKITIK